MLFALHWPSVAKVSCGGKWRGKWWGEGGSKGWRGMQPCIGSAGSLRASHLPSSHVHVQAASVTHLPAETWEGNVSKHSKWSLVGQSGAGSGSGAKREEGGVCSFQLVTINKSSVSDLGPAPYSWNERQRFAIRALYV